MVNARSAATMRRTGCKVRRFTVKGRYGNYLRCPTGKTVKKETKKCWTRRKRTSAGYLRCPPKGLKGVGGATTRRASTKRSASSVPSVTNILGKSATNLKSLKAAEKRFENLLKKDAIYKLERGTAVIYNALTQAKKDKLNENMTNNDRMLTEVADRIEEIKKIKGDNPKLVRIEVTKARNEMRTEARKLTNDIASQKRNAAQWRTLIQDRATVGGKGSKGKEILVVPSTSSTNTTSTSTTGTTTLTGLMPGGTGGT